MKRLGFGAAALLLFACAPPSPTRAPVQETAIMHDAPAGEYKLDAAHADLSFRVSHVGFSMYTARFAHWDATLQFDPAHPESMSVVATVDTRSLALPSPPAGFTETMLGPQWFDVARFPQMEFHSRSVERIGPNGARVLGDFTLHGVTKPVTLDVRFNGGYSGNEFEPRARIGFSATGALKRSDFGITSAIPAPGSTLGVGDEVLLMIEAEFSGPPLQNAAR